VPLGTKFNGTHDNAAVNAIGATSTRVLVGGSFLSMGGETRNNAVALSTQSGRALPWDVATSHAVHALARGPGAVYVGGAFTNLNDTASNGLSAVDPTTGDLDPQWAFTATADYATPVVRALVATEDALYVGGNFTTVGGTALRLLAAVDPDTGLPSTYDAALSGGYQGVTALALADDTLYLAGDFNKVANQSRTRLAAISAVDATPVDWTPNPNQEVYTLCATTDRLYVGGLFTRISGIDLRNLAVYDLATRDLLPWDPALPASASGIYSIAAVETCVYVSGYYNAIGGEFRNYLASLGPWTAAAQEWAPNPNAAPSLIALSDHYVCVGGTFRTVGAAPNVYPLGFLAIYGRAPAIVSCTLSAGMLTFEATSGDMTRSVLKASPDLRNWTPLATNDLTGYLWMVGQAVPVDPRMYYGVWAE
jgi:hypothetical protein